MLLRYSSKRNLFWVSCTFEERAFPLQAGFEWNEQATRWTTPSPYAAFALTLLYTDVEVSAPAMRRTHTVRKRYRSACALDGPDYLLCPEGEAYLPYQRGGIAHGMEELKKLGRHVLIGDEQGLGKTIQLIGICNQFRWKKPLIICPASLRLNWKRELDKWLMYAPPAYAVMNGKDDLSRYPGGPLILSYNMASREDWLWELMTREWDVVGMDEAQYLKNPDSLRSQAILGDNKRKGLARWVGRSIPLSGTIAPNRISELHPLIYRLAPAIIDNRAIRSFEGRWVEGYVDQGSFVPTGVKRPKELAVRMRGSGFMVRRRKDDVLTDLPPKRYQMIVFPQDSATAEVVEKESAFDPQEIIQYGPDKVNLASEGSLSTVRKEMGLAKLGVCLQWIKDTLDSVEKLVVFAWHREVIDALEEGLADYDVVKVYGGTSAKKAQGAVDRFQTDPTCRVIVGNLQTLGTGHTLTAASHVAFVEADWVPGNNDQCADRCHRIGQTASSVNVYFLVIDGSLDAYILSRAAEKAADLSKVMD